MSQRDLGLAGPTQEVLTALVGQSVRELNAGDIRAQTGLPVGTIYPMLARLEALHWVNSGWPHAPVQHAGSRRRRYYRLIPRGFAMTRHELAHHARASTREPS